MSGGPCIAKAKPSYQKWAGGGRIRRQPGQVGNEAALTIRIRVVRQPFLSSRAEEALHWSAARRGSPCSPSLRLEGPALGRPVLGCAGTNSTTVIPAQVGTQASPILSGRTAINRNRAQVPTCAGMTKVVAAMSERGSLLCLLLPEPLDRKCAFGCPLLRRIRRLTILRGQGRRSRRVALFVGQHSASRCWTGSPSLRLDRSLQSPSFVNLCRASFRSHLPLTNTWQASVADRARTTPSSSPRRWGPKPAIFFFSVCPE